MNPCFFPILDKSLFLPVLDDPLLFLSELDETSFLPVLDDPLSFLPVVDEPSFLPILDEPSFLPVLDEPPSLLPELQFWHRQVRWTRFLLLSQLNVCCPGQEGANFEAGFINAWHLESRFSCGLVLGLNYTASGPSPRGCRFHYSTIL